LPRWGLFFESRATIAAVHFWRSGLNNPIKVDPSQAVRLVRTQNATKPVGIQQVTPVQPGIARLLNQA
jgi:hypothetical protein